MKFGFGFRSTNSSSGGSSTGGGGGNGGHISRGRSKKIDDRPFPPQLEEHPYFNYFPVVQQNYYTRYVPRPPPAYQLPPPPPAPPSTLSSAGPGGTNCGFNQHRKRHGSFSSENHSSKLSQASSNNFHFRSRSSSGRFRYMKTPSDFYVIQNHSKSNETLDHFNNNNHHHHNLAGNSNSPREEPIYSEPFPPENDLSHHHVGVGNNIASHAVNKQLKFYPDPRDPVQISNHIYEFLVSSKKGGSKSEEVITHLIPTNASKRRGSLSSSPSDGSSTNHSKQPDFSSGRRNFFLHNGLKYKKTRVISNHGKILA